MGSTCSTRKGVAGDDATPHTITSDTAAAAAASRAAITATGRTAARRDIRTNKWRTGKHETNDGRRKGGMAEKSGHHASAALPAEEAATARSSGPAVTASSSAPPPSPLDRLGDDLLLTVLSYVSYAPGEAAPAAWSLPYPRAPKKRARRGRGRGGRGDADPSGGALAAEVTRLMEAYNEDVASFEKATAGRQKKGKGGKSKGKRQNKDRDNTPYVSPFREASYYYQLGFGDEASAGGGDTTTDGTSSSTRTAVTASSSSSSSSARVVGSARNFGTLIHVLPHVCKRWHALCGGPGSGSDGREGATCDGDDGGITYPSHLHESTDFLWREALIRMAGRGGEDWTEGLAEYVAAESSMSMGPPASSGFVPVGPGDPSTAAIMRERAATDGDVGGGAQAAVLPEPSDAAPSPATPVDVGPLVEKACHLAGTACPAQCVYRKVRANHVRPSLPVFYLPMAQPPGGRRFLTLGRAVSLHLFEPRYRLMMAELMKDRSMAERNGVPLSLSSSPTSSRRPRFLYAYEAPLGRGSGAYVVEVRRCVLHNDGRRGNGTADVVIVPTEEVVLDRVTERPNSGRLHDATARGVGVMVGLGRR